MSLKSAVNQIRTEYICRHSHFVSQVVGKHFTIAYPNAITMFFAQREATTDYFCHAKQSEIDRSMVRTFLYEVTPWKYEWLCCLHHQSCFLHHFSRLSLSNILAMLSLPSWHLPLVWISSISRGTFQEKQKTVITLHKASCHQDHWRPFRIRHESLLLSGRTW